MDTVFERLEQGGDRWRDALTAKQDITRSLAVPGASSTPGGGKAKARK
jgi:hypothetical protein